MLLIIPLVIESNKEEKVVDKSKGITWELKMGSRKQLPAMYKKMISCFEEETEFEVNQLIYNIREVFKQNKIITDMQRNNIIENLLLGESLDIYRGMLKDQRQPTEEGRELFDITKEMVKTAMQELRKTVFLFCTLDKQKAYMQRNMKVP